MRANLLLISALAMLPVSLLCAQNVVSSHDPKLHRVQFVTVDQDVKLEVLDWGGSGPPLVFLAGLGNNAHVFDRFAPKFVGSNHVYGITRRGFGASSAPLSGYSADRLGDDVLAVLESLNLQRPVLVGHSIGGSELSSIGSRHPEKVAGLVYLDAAYSYAFYNAATALDPDLVIGKDASRISRLVFAGVQKYTDIRPPILAIYAYPHDFKSILDEAVRKSAEESDPRITGEQSKAFEAAFPSARVVRLPNANHYVFLSNEADVLREMNTFLNSLRSAKN
jgi:pimeloyl-ACP methyl ester carboxylesterase